MEYGQYQVIGISTFVKSTDQGERVGTNLFLCTPFDEWEKTGSGMKTLTEFTYNAVNVKPGDIVTLSYRKGFKGNAVLSAVNVVSTK